MQQKKKIRPISYGCKILVKLGICPNDFQNSTRLDGFLKNGSELHVSRVLK